MDTKKLLLTAGCTAVVAGLATKMLLGEYDEVKFFNMEVSTPVANGLACGAGSIVSDVSSDLVIRKLNISNQLANGSTFAVKASVGGAASAAVLYLGGIPASASNIALSFGIGAGAKMAGDYAYDIGFDPVRGFIPLF